VFPDVGSASPVALEAIVRIAAGEARNIVQDELGCHVAVGGVSFSVAEGEVFCIMGLSGSGKSTLLRLLNRLIAPTRGRVAIKGADLATMEEGAIRTLRARSVSMVFQDVALWPHMTVRENVAYGLAVQGIERRRREAVAEDMLARVQLAGWGARYSHELSGGMRQRVGLARALAVDPSIILLDEPFSALDPLIRDELQGEFESVIRQSGKTAVFITHDLAEAMRLGERIAIMKDGRFVQVDRPERILLAPENDYVRAFVRSVPRLQVLKAVDIMKPLQTGQIAEADLVRISADAPLAAVVRIAGAIGGIRSIVVIDAGGQEIGLIDPASLLRSLTS
jgi:glycine betaine/proline transport system ATP-binding protein